MSDNDTIPWVEKYRPTSFDQIVLDETNHRILKNIVETNRFPNLLLYGPPGTGKTTTIMNLINSYQKKYNQLGKGLTIHLNASDERGIDIIRNQISQFVNSQALFTTGLKIVVLDEVDYMTKNAQHALKYLLQDRSTNVRFCLICNYISRIDDSLQNELLHLRFNQLPSKKITDFLSIIAKNEKVNVTTSTLKAVQRLFKSDIRSMINYLQSNQYDINVMSVLDDAVWNSLTESIKIGKDNAKAKLYEIQNNYHIDVRNIIKDYLNYIIAYEVLPIDSDFINFSEFIMHLSEPNALYLVDYFLEKIGTWDIKIFLS
uniref:AAA+ ATPase domain-containing protein n=1 Tax=viral metagenome TaxID=1070528 RepID=A0A6C0LH31_9ZZZZ